MRTITPIAAEDGVLLTATLKVGQLNVNAHGELQGGAPTQLMAGLMAPLEGGLGGDCFVASRLRVVAPRGAGGEEDGAEVRGRPGVEVVHLLGHVAVNLPPLWARVLAELKGLGGLGLEWRGGEGGGGGKADAEAAVEELVVDTIRALARLLITAPPGRFAVQSKVRSRRRKG
jgi:hypothetical protein